MSHADLPPIPIPAAERWREFRNRTVPLLTFAASIVAICWLWQSAVSPASLIGQVEPVTMTISSPDRAVVDALNVERFQAVKAGTPLATLRINDRREEMDFMRNQLETLRLGTDPEMTARRTALDYQKLRLAWLQQKVDLSAAEIKLQFAATELDRATKLFGEKAITEKAFDASRRQKEAVEAEVKERSKLVADLGKELDTLAVPEFAAADEALRTVIAAQQKRMKTIEDEIGRLVLTAPVDGVISAVVRRPGENVGPGDPVVLITAERSAHIIGYLREPFPVEPKLGMEVEVQARSRQREKGVGRVVRVGLGFEPVANPELHPAAHAESGLPIEISLPPGMSLRPGQLVSLTLRPNS